ncbi:metal-dependent hydrolase [candidate division KSB3 bacterium]|uniref:Metal-dependent hydrolase n=1 Tax=candidate division KSB3 bacterium TaxID=2044937 RepID=A0A9D5JV16_9BACT|nr:metal-dependent hydrolase [candidate division KSB3 bacterium]MBD3324442.1 metal-dependent hydrolase [candidate division KSB3 bacterium]
MNPITHFLISWDVANIFPSNRRDRAIITLAGILPDVDAFGAIPELLTRHSAHPLFWWTEYHHILGHNLVFGGVLALGSFALAAKRWKTALLALLTFHVHVLGDVIGGRGPDGYQWPIPYLYPFSDAWQLVWEGQWELNAWPNFVMTGIALALMFWLAWKQGFSPLEMISAPADRAFVKTLRHRFGDPKPAKPRTI